MSERENITDILCIGCQKGSTSWLHSTLNRHPDTHAFPNSKPVTSTNKEAHFWDWNHHRGVEWYRQLMTPKQAHKKSMDFTPEYAFLPEHHIAECKRLSPTARVIYILRDPMARAVSALRMHLLWRFGPDHDQPLALGDLFKELLGKARLDQHGAFARNHARWSRHYDDILLLNYEDFHTDRPGSVARVMAHCGLDADRMSDDDRARLDDMLGKRVWASEKFPVERDVLLFLHGYTWRTREAVASAFGMRFAEGERLLDGG